jgi:hypothetical protein
MNGARRHSADDHERGFEKIVDGMDVPVVPVHLNGVWCSIFSFAGGRFFRELPRRVPYPVTVSFGKPMPASTIAHEARLAVQELAAEAVARKTGAPIRCRCASSPAPGETGRDSPWRIPRAANSPTDAH